MWPAEKVLYKVSLIKSIQLENETNCRNRQILISNVTFHSGLYQRPQVCWLILMWIISGIKISFILVIEDGRKYNSKTLNHNLEPFHTVVWFLFCHRCLIMCLKEEIRVSEYIWTHWWPVTSPAAGVWRFAVDLLSLQKLQRTKTAEITNKYINNKINMKWINLSVLTYLFNHLFLYSLPFNFAEQKLKYKHK